MKKIYYLLAFVSIAAFSCKPLSKTYEGIDGLPLSKTSINNFVLTTSDYKTLPSTYYAYSALYFKSTADADANIPTILTARYPVAENLASANVTFNIPPSSSTIAVPDSTFSRISFTLAAADYVFPGNTVASLTSTTVITYLNYKYPTPAANQMVLLTYNYVESGITTAAGTTNTDTFIYQNNSWNKVYTLTPNQYASVGRGGNNWFLQTDIPNLASYFNSFLKADPTVVAIAKAGTAISVSYRYLTTYQKILILTFDGTNWVAKVTLPYLRLSGIWVPDPSVTIIELVGVNADYIYLKTTTIGSDAARANLASFGDFNIQSKTSTSYWSDDDITAAFAAILLRRIANPIKNVPYKVIYSVYTGTVSTTSKTYQWDGTKFYIPLAN